MLVNAASSAATGLLLVVDAGPAAGLFGAVSPTPFVWVGAFLILFGAEVWLISRQNPIRPALVQLVIALDVSWVVCSLAIVGLQLFSLSLAGYVLITAVALWVAAMAILQRRGLRTLQLG